MCRTDAVNWRNAANNADEGLTTDAVDALVVSQAGGITLTGATPIIHFGGETNAFPAWLRSGTTLQARLADNSGDASITASTVAFNGAGGASVVISGPCTTGQVLTAASANSITCAASSPGILLHTNTTAIVNATFGNTNTVIFSKSVTMPLVGCPCRALATYALYVTTSNAGVQAAMVSDGTNNWAGSVANETGSVATIGVGQNGTGTSPGTYSNGQVVTFTVQAASTAAGSATANSGVGAALTGAPASQLVIDVYGSN
jgi:hypothetical protein